MMPKHWLFYQKNYLDSLKIIFFCILIACIQAILLVYITVLVQEIFDKIIPQKNKIQLFLVGLMIIGLYITNGILALWVRFWILSITKKIIQNIRNKVLTHFFTLSETEQKKTTSNQIHLQHLLIQDTERINIMSNALVAQLLPSFIISSVICVGLLYINTLFFLMTVALVPFIALASKFMGNFIQKKYQNFYEIFQFYSKNWINIILNKQNTYINATIPQTIQKQQQIQDDLAEATKQNLWWQTAFTVIQDNLLAVGGVFIILIGGIYVINNEISFGELFAFYVALALLKTYIYRIFTNIPQVIEGNISLKNIYDFLENKPKLNNKTQIIDFQGDIKINNVSFCYDSPKNNLHKNTNNRQILHKKTIHLQKNTITLLFGKNGSGKSTLIKLILGILEPTEGEILFDNQAQKLPPLTQIGVLMQNPNLIEGSLFENIVCERAYHTYTLDLQAQVEQACKWVGLHEWAESLSEGYQTPIFPEKNLSGGQIQRIALARAILGNPRFLILDEPTNHLDEKIIMEIINNLRNLPQKPTILLVSHRKELQNIADQIINF